MFFEVGNFPFHPIFTPTHPTIPSQNICLTPPCDTLKYLRSVHIGMRQLMSEVFRVAQLIMVCPATNATSERSFSALRRAKSYLQSTMMQSRLNSILLLHVHKDRTDSLDLIEVANEFVSLRDVRKSTFDTFTHTDFKRTDAHVKSKALKV